MKKPKQLLHLYCTLLFSTAIFCAAATAQGVDWQDLTWAQAKSKAKKEKKLIFLDAYTTWCAPCKVMDKEVFVRVPVGDYYNANFVAIKKDMEKGEGLLLARQFNIHAFPTFVFADADGKMLHTDAGGKDMTATILMGETAFDPINRLAAQDEQFLQGGNADLDFVRNYIEKRANLQNHSHQEAVEAYLLLQNNWENEENMDFIMKYVQNPGSKAFDYLYEQKDQFSKQFGKQKVSSKIETCVYDELYKGTSRTGVAAMDKVLQRQYGERAAYYLSRYKIVFAKATFDLAAFNAAATTHFQQFPPEDPAEWSTIALDAADLTNDEATLTTALQWIDKGLAQEDNFDCRLAKAKVLQRMGKTKKAKKMTKKTIAWAKKKEEDATAAQKFLESL